MSRYIILNSIVDREKKEYYFVIKDMNSNKTITIFASYVILPSELRKAANKKYIKSVDIPSDCDKNKLYKEILKVEPGFLFYIPEEEQTEELIKIALSEDGSSLEFISKENITEELSNMAISSNGLAIYFVPKKMQTLKMCREAVLNNPRAILKVKKSIAPELYQEFIQDNYNAWAHFTSEELISLENNLKK